LGEILKTPRDSGELIMLFLQRIAAHFKYAWISILLLPGITGCASSASSPATAVSPSPASAQSGCPEAPTGTLDPNNVKRIGILSGSTSISGIAKQNQLLGYAFRGEAKQKFSYTPTDPDLCVWVYTPDNKVLSDLELPTSGSYTVQVAAKQGTKAFNMELSVGDRVSSVPVAPAEVSPSSSSSQSDSTFSRSDFPKAECGDPLPTDPSAYPVSFYPVRVPDTDSNLRQATSSFCQDSFRKRAKDTNEKIIQIASFTSEQRAQAFAKMLRSEINGVSVGSPTVRQQFNTGAGE
jgi:hypothetical protein